MLHATHSRPFSCRPPRRPAKRFVLRSSLDSKALHILPIRFLMNGTCRAPVFTKSRHLTVWLLIATLMKLEVELLCRCGMMPRSEQRSLVGREVLGTLSGSVTAGHRRSAGRASFPIETPKNTSWILASLEVKQTSIGEPFWRDPASKRKTWRPRSVYEWAR
jgi:hypothetical protein